MKELAKQYRERGYAIAWIKPGDKRPMHSGWSSQSQEIDDYTEGSNIGLLLGRLSGNLVNIDLDSAEAISKADDFLPPTGMIEGRPGKPRSHRYYVVTDIPEEMESVTCAVKGGPFTKSFRSKDGPEIIQFQGTGRHAVAPPSYHDSGEQRQWESFGDPAVVDCRELFEAVEKLAEACGWQKKAERRRTYREPKKTKDVVRKPKIDRDEPVPDVALIALGDRIERAVKYVARISGAVSGRGGHNETYKVAQVLMNDFALPYEDALTIMEEYNLRCRPPWSLSELVHKLTTVRLNSSYGSKGRADDYRFPQRLAEEFLQQHNWVVWKGGYFEYRGTHYVELSKETAKNAITDFVRSRFFLAHKELMDWWERQDPRPQKCPKPAPVTTAVVNNVLLNIGGMVGLSDTLSLPGWFDGTDRHVIPLKNGLLDPETGELIDHTPEFFSTNCLPYDYDPTAKCDKFVDALNLSLQGKQELIAVIQEFFGYCLTKSTDKQKTLFLLGDGANGKSVTLAALVAMVGKENISSVPLEKFGERFSLYNTFGKLVNISGDAGNLRGSNLGCFKAYVSGDPIEFERKNKDPFSDVPTAKLVSAVNDVPSFTDRSDGVWRRLIIVPYQYQIPEELRIEGMDNPRYWREETPGILNWALEGLQRLKDHGFTKCDEVDSIIDETRSHSLPTLQFLEQYEDGEGEIGSEHLYDEYRQWCDFNGYRPEAIVNFTRQVRKRFPNAEKKPKGKKKVTTWVGIKEAV